MRVFQGTQARVRNSHRAISVRATEVLLYLQKSRLAALMHIDIFYLFGFAY